MERLGLAVRRRHPRGRARRDRAARSRGSARRQRQVAGKARRGAHARARRRARGDAAPAGDRGRVPRRRDLPAHRARRRTSPRAWRSGSGCPAGQVTLLRQAAPLHDVGKLAIPDRILLKPGRLTEEEFEVMKTHAELGARLLSSGSSRVLQTAAVIAATHHERWDGTGYPNGCAGDAIPLVGRIVAVADVFDALTHDRPYKQAWPVEQRLRGDRALGRQPVRPARRSPPSWRCAPTWTRICDDIDNAQPRRRPGDLHRATDGDAAAPARRGLEHVDLHAPRAEPSQRRVGERPVRSLLGARERSGGAARPRRPRPSARRAGRARRSSSASCTALVAAPLRRLSATIHRSSARSWPASRRMRPTNTSSWPLASIASGYSAASGSSSTVTPGAAAEQLARALGRELLARLHVDGLGVPVDDRHAHARRRDRDRRVAEDLARLVDQLALLVGVVVARREAAGVRQRVEGDLVGVRGGRVDRRARAAARATGRAARRRRACPCPRRPGRC